MKFKIGDRVRMKYNPKVREGLLGTVINLSWMFVGIELDTFVDGHTCDGVGKLGYCYWFMPYNLKKLDEAFTESFNCIEKLKSRVHYTKIETNRIQTLHDECRCSCDEVVRISDFKI